MRRTGERTPTGTEDRVFRATPPGEARRRTLRFTRRRRLRSGREATRSKATSTGQPGRRVEGHASMHRAAGLPEATGNAATEQVNHGSTPTATEVRGSGRHDDGTGNRVSVNGATLRDRATDSGATLSTGVGQPTNRLEGHRHRATGGGAIGNGPGNRKPGHNGHRPPCLRARRAMCRSMRRLTPEGRPVVDRPTFG
jgi:hypothetical protein